MRLSIELLKARLVEANAKAGAGNKRAAPYIEKIDTARQELPAVEQEASRLRLQDDVGRHTPHRSVDRSIGIEL